MITTKRAKGREAVVSFDAKWGVNSRATRLYDYIDNPGDYYETYYKSLYNYYLASGTADQATPAVWATRFIRFPTANISSVRTARSTPTPRWAAKSFTTARTTG